MELFTLSIAISNLVGVILTADTGVSTQSTQQQSPVHDVSTVACVQTYIPTHARRTLYYSSEWLKSRSCLQPSSILTHCLQTELQSSGIFKTKTKVKKKQREESKQEGVNNVVFQCWTLLNVSKMHVQVAVGAFPTSKAILK